MKGYLSKIVMKISDEKSLNLLAVFFAWSISLRALSFIYNLYDTFFLRHFISMFCIVAIIHIAYTLIKNNKQ